MCVKKKKEKKNVGVFFLLFVFCFVRAAVGICSSSAPITLFFLQSFLIFLNHTLQRYYYYYYCTAAVGSSTVSCHFLFRVFRSFFSSGLFCRVFVPTGYASIPLALHFD